ncbi:O-antigen ligase family protein [Winogradskyella sp.]|uniref:O-antigen ligase family protein n=1 Tax=Winogradskyella sp. TaxID=1883156 RepID=UPI003F6ACF41
MSVKSKIESVINHKDFLNYLLALTLSTLLVGYAPSSIAMVLFCLFAIRYALKNKIKFELTPLLSLCMLLYVLCCASYFWTVDQALTLKGLGRLFLFVLLPLIFSIIPRFTFRSFQTVLNGFTISNILLGFFFLVLAFVNYFKNGNATVFTYHDFVQVLDLNAIYVSVFYTLSYFFLLSKQIKKRFDYFGLLFLGVLILLLSSKSTIAVFLLGNLIYFFIYKGIRALKSKKTIGVLLVTIVVLSFASREIVNRILIESTTNLEEVINREKFNRVYPWTGTSIRLLQLRNLKGQIEEDGIFWKGFGLFASRKNLSERHLAFNTYYGFHRYNYHNMYAQILSELGIFGLLTLLVILGLGFKKSFKAKSFFMLMFYFLMVMIFITESFLWVHRGVFLFVIMNCIFQRTDFPKIKEVIKSKTKKLSNY